MLIREFRRPLMLCRISQRILVPIEEVWRLRDDLTDQQTSFWTINNQLMDTRDNLQIERTKHTAARQLISILEENNAQLKASLKVSKTAFRELKGRFEQGRLANRELTAELQHLQDQYAIEQADTATVPLPDFLPSSTKRSSRREREQQQEREEDSPLPSPDHTFGGRGRRIHVRTYLRQGRIGRQW